MDQPSIYELIQKYKDDTATDAERQALMEWYRSIAYRDAEFPEDEASVKASMLQRLEMSITPIRTTYRRNWYIAASVILLLGIGAAAVITRKTHQPEPPVAVQQPPHDIGPGANKAILTLANGAKVSLTDADKGNIADQSGITISKSADGKIVYTATQQNPNSPTNPNNPASPETSQPLAINKIETPPGGQFQVVLPDGTRVWLNASTWLKFPVRFSPGERRVELSGEAYFEVQRNPAAPFRVSSQRQEIEVLGTHFNVHAYADEPHIKTTLLEGSVRVASGQSSVLLKPNEQADLGGSDKLRVSQADVEYAIAWKKGYFRYEDERVETIMQHVSRWYNVQVVFEDAKLKDETLGVLSTRFANISALLNKLEQTSQEAKFTLKESTVMISRKN